MARVEEIGAGKPLVLVRDTNRYEPVLKVQRRPRGRSIFGAKPFNTGL